MPEWSEILVILVVAMVVFGPHRLPAMARRAGRMMAEFRTAARELREGIEKELAVEELREVAKDVRSTTKEAGHQARKSLAESDKALRTPPSLARPGDTTPGAERESQTAVPSVPDPDLDSEETPSPPTASESGTDHSDPDHPVEEPSDRTEQADQPS